jgi:hypothetical protein
VADCGVAELGRGRLHGLRVDVTECHLRASAHQVLRRRQTDAASRARDRHDRPFSSTSFRKYADQPMPPTVT